MPRRGTQTGGLGARIARAAVVFAFIGGVAQAPAESADVTAPMVVIEDEAATIAGQRTDAANARMLLEAFSKGSEGTEAFYHAVALVTGNEEWLGLTTDFTSVERWMEAATRIASTVPVPGITLITAHFAAQKVLMAELGDSQEAARSLFITHNPELVAAVVRKAVPLLKAERARRELPWYEQLMGQGDKLDAHFGVPPESLKGTKRAESLKVLAQGKVRYFTDKEIEVLWPELADRLQSEEQGAARDVVIDELGRVARSTYRTVREHSDAAARAVHAEARAEVAKALCGKGNSAAGRELACKREDYEKARRTVLQELEEIEEHGPEAYGQRMEGLGEIAELDKRIAEVARAERVLAVKEATGTARAWSGVLVAGLALSSPDDARNVQALSTGALDILEGLGTMLAGTLLDPSGISMVLSGIGTLVALGEAPGPTHEEIVRETLEELLGGQEWLGAKLDRVEGRIAVLQSDVDTLTDIARMSLAVGREERAQIGASIDTLEQRMTRAQARLALSLTTLSDQEEQRELLAKTEGFKGQFTNWRERQAGVELSECVEHGERRCSERALDATEEIRRYLGDLAHRLEGTPTHEERAFGRITPSQAQALLESGAEERTPLAASMLDWLDGEDKARGGQGTPTQARRPFIDPHRTAVLIAQYRTLARLVPTRTADGQLIRDANLARIETAEAVLEAQARAMREALPAAWRTYLHYSTEAANAFAKSALVVRARMGRVQVQGQGMSWRRLDLLTTDPTRAVETLTGADVHTVGRHLGATTVDPHDARRRTGMYAHKDRAEWTRRLLWRSAVIEGEPDPFRGKWVKDPRTGRDRMLRVDEDFGELYAPDTPNTIREEIRRLRGAEKGFKTWRLLAKAKALGFWAPTETEGFCKTGITAVAGCDYEKWWKKKVEEELDLENVILLCSTGRIFIKIICKKALQVDKVRDKIHSHMKRYRRARTHEQWKDVKYDTCPYPVQAQACVEAIVGVRDAIVKKLLKRQHDAWLALSRALPQQTRAQWARAKLALDTALTMGYADGVETDSHLRRARRVVRRLPATTVLDDAIAEIRNKHPRLGARFRAFEAAAEAGLVTQGNVRRSARLLAALAGDDPQAYAGRYYNPELLPRCESEAERGRRLVADELTRRAIVRTSEAVRDEFDRAVLSALPDPDAQQSTLLWQAHAHDARTGRTMERRVRNALDAAGWQPTPREHPSCADVMRAPWDFAQHPTGAARAGTATLDLGLNPVAAEAGS